MTDWEALFGAAREARTHAYAPYSDFSVGAAGLVDDGRLVTGCNVENASYGLSLCAECSMVSALHSSGGGRLTAVACVGPYDSPVTPCGRCRQILSEHATPDAEVNQTPLSALLPDAFGPDDLGARTHGD